MPTVAALGSGRAGHGGGRSRISGGIASLAEDGASEVAGGPLPEIFSPGRWRELGTHLGLTPRQQQIARLLCKGFAKSEAAKELGISVPTVRMHADALYKRLGVHSRLALAVRLVLAERRLK